jgi:hypothetical protein
MGKSMDEAFSDYFACAKNENADWAGSRNISSPNKVYPTDFNSSGSAHTNGLIVSGACWDLRSKIGVNTTNTLVFESLGLMDANYSRPYSFGKYIDCVYEANDTPSYDTWIEWAFTTVHGIERYIAKREVPDYKNPTTSKNIQTPPKHSLNQNYPNPFNSTTRIKYEIDDTQMRSSYDTNLRIFNIHGQLIKVLETGIKSPGQYTTTWQGVNENGDYVSTGIYIVELTVDHYVLVQREMEFSLYRIS